MSNYITRVSNEIAERFAGQPEYVQAVQNWLEALAPAATDPAIEKADLLRRMVEPDRMITFTVPWIDDEGFTHTNHGYRCQFNNAIGPYKGGTRFQANVRKSTIKFLAFEQTYKNALTGLSIGGAAGGADFDPQGKSRREIMRFCHSYMDQLFRYIGADADIPSSDIGVGRREIGFMYGEYKRLSGIADPSVMTSKGVSYGGTKVRKQAGGFGAMYFLGRMAQDAGDTVEGKTIAVSGFGNLAWGVCRTARDMGAKVVTLSSKDGSIYDPDGIITDEKIDFIDQLRRSGAGSIEPYAEKFGVEFRPGKTPWDIPVDVAIPCATENELDVEDAVALIANGVKYYVEAANMPATAQALRLLRLSPRITVAGSKAAGTGGVAVSALEMAQNSIRISWTDEEMQTRLEEVMASVYDESAKAAAEYDTDLVSGNDIAAFKKVAATMLAEGL